MIKDKNEELFTSVERVITGTSGVRKNEKDDSRQRGIILNMDKLVLKSRTSGISTNKSSFSSELIASPVHIDFNKFCNQIKSDLFN